jgi:hypothetical protein
MKERMRRMLERAVRLNVRDEVIRGLTEVIQLLRQSPKSWGDPLRHLHYAQLTEYRGQHRNFQAVYSVHDRIPIVFLVKLRTLQGNPIHGEEFGT